MLREAAGFLPPAVRFTGEYRDSSEELARTEFESAASRSTRAMASLARLLERARDHAPFWAEARIPKGVLSPGDAMEVLRSLPLVHKETIRDDLRAFTLGDVPASQREYLTTGGSSGIPFGFYLRRGYSQRERAHIHSVWRRFGWEPGTPTAVFRGAYVPTATSLWGWDRYSAELRFSGYHLTPADAPSMLAEVARRRIAFMQCYPSAAVLLSRLVQDGAAPRPHLRAIFLGSESVRPWQRRLIEETFGCPTAVWYGHAEAAAFASVCEHDVGYHVDERYGILELVDESGRVIDEAGVVGEIVATGLLGPATAFIRYRTADLASWAEPGSCACGRPGRRLAAIHGRVQEFVVSREGRPVSATAINMHNDLFDNVLRFQFLQVEPGEVDLLLMPAARFTEADEERIRREIGDKLGKGFVLRLQRVAEIPLSPRGKQRFIDQRLPLDKYSVPLTTRDS